MITIDASKTLDHETLFFYAASMDRRLRYVMDQAKIKYTLAPAHRVHDLEEYETVKIPKTVISRYGELSNNVRVMFSFMDPKYMEEKMKEIIYDKDLEEIDHKARTKIL